MANEKRFWMVWNPGNRAPSFKHKTQDAAKQEAERLAKLHPGKEFVVLQSVGTVRTRETEWVEHDASYFIANNFGISIGPTY